MLSMMLSAVLGGAGLGGSGGFSTLGGSGSFGFIAITSSTGFGGSGLAFGCSTTLGGSGLGCSATGLGVSGAGGGSAVFGGGALLVSSAILAFSGCCSWMPTLGAAAFLAIASNSTITGSGSIGGGLKKLKFTIVAAIANTCTPTDRIAGVRISALPGARSDIDRLYSGTDYFFAGAAAGLPSACSPSRPSCLKPESITTPITSIMRPYWIDLSPRMNTRWSGFSSCTAFSLLPSSASSNLVSPRKTSSFELSDTTSGSSLPPTCWALVLGKSTGTPTCRSGAVIMKITSSTSMTSTMGVTLMSAIGT